MWADVKLWRLYTQFYKHGNVASHVYCLLQPKWYWAQKFLYKYVHLYCNFTIQLGEVYHGTPEELN